MTSVLQHNIRKQEQVTDFSIILYIFTRILTLGISASKMFMTIVQHVLYLYCIMWQTHCCYYQQEMTKYCPTLLPILFYCHGTVGKGETKAVGSSERMDNLCKTACRLTMWGSIKKHVPRGHLFLKTLCSRKTFQKAPMV